MTERDFLKYIEALCKRPKMYTPTGSFYEMVSFLEGYGAGANVGEGAYHSSLTPFLKWAVKKFGIQELIIDWKEFRQLFSSDSEALSNLPTLYEEYLGSIE